ARPEESAAVQSALRGWLAGCGVPAGAARSAAAVGGEAFAGALAAAPGGTLRLSATATADRLRVTVLPVGGGDPVVAEAALPS
ncbi:hypothetical protein ACFC6L_29780, partial [Kitasatospora phosalacinea]|uniref:hypothetical protein n=1 Tax=Kitasatospora phosalacinea TaxID=2065 RepID=UPI0035DCDC2E